MKPDSELGWILPDNQRAKLADYRGKILVLDFYATWCLPCRESIPRLIALQRNYGPAGVQVVGLNVGGADDRIKVAEFYRELHIQYPLGFPDQALTDLFLSDDQTIPQTFVFGREGQLVKRFIGYQESTGAELDKTIKVEVGKWSEKRSSRKILDAATTEAGKDVAAKTIIESLVRRRKFSFRLLSKRTIEKSGVKLK